MFSNFNSFIYGATFWQTLMTNWWYNVGREVVKDAIDMSKSCYSFYIHNLGEIDSLNRRLRDKLSTDRFLVLTLMLQNTWYSK
jgi:hypothetical protein